MNIKVDDHFVDVDKMVEIGSNSKRITKDYRLTRYTCSLIAQSADSRKKVIALAKTYFAIQTWKQELSEKEYNELTEDEKRLYRRNQARKYNLSLNKTAVNSGVKDSVRFHNAGYKGLYNGETADDIFKRKIRKQRTRMQWIWEILIGLKRILNVKKKRVKCVQNWILWRWKMQR